MVVTQRGVCRWIIEGFLLHLFYFTQLCHIDPERSGAFLGTDSRHQNRGDGFGPVNSAWAVSLDAIIRCLRTFLVGPSSGGTQGRCYFL